MLLYFTRIWRRSDLIYGMLRMRSDAVLKSDFTFFGITWPAVDLLLDL